ncbi:hypothetical protein RB4918 [Rhodopirellula baltica SH 1]|uniref:Uncharacterized protein n=1 Tax=Rhodopirellula baltica (strain DSM 10527 / NCIMB 13988 / SH1) TaxID=243090 RepID=Q7UH03_RHOBA|nr:hypothetical protein RB4918 [Rhodopirellula baltica SH 1]
MANDIPSLETQVGSFWQPGICASVDALSDPRTLGCASTTLVEGLLCVDPFDQ